MFFLISNRGLLQGVMAGALVLASAAACTRADRSETGLADTSLQADSAAGYRAMERDTANAPTESSDAVESERIRPPEDSTELRGDGTSYETADEQVIDAVRTER